VAYTFDHIEARDPNIPSLVASNAAVVIFAPGDTTKTPLALTDTTGSPLPNPVQVNGMGYGPAFISELDRVAWEGGGYTGFFTSYEGMKEVAVASQAAAETAAATAGADAAAIATAAIGTATDAASTAASSASASATAAANAAALVGAPADTAIAAAVTGSGTATKAALNATYVHAETDAAGDVTLYLNGVEL
jgi:hypothetical protein